MTSEPTSPLLGPAFADQTPRSFYDYVTGLYSKPTKKVKAPKPPKPAKFAGKWLAKPSVKLGRLGLLRITLGDRTVHMTHAAAKPVARIRVAFAAMHLACAPAALATFLRAKKIRVDEPVPRE